MCYNNVVMNAKTIRKYNLIIEIASYDAAHPKLASSFAELCSIDFQAAFEMWELTLTKFSEQLADVQICANLDEKLFAMFNRISETKTRTLFIESLPLNKLIYAQSVAAATGTNLAFLANLILSNKLDSAEEILRCLRANTTGDYGERMRMVVDEIFKIYCTKNNVKVPSLNKKQSTLLLAYIEKIKGPNKKLLTQRIKEL